MRLDAKSAAVGVLAGAAIVAGLGAMQPDGIRQPDQRVAPNAAPEVGRYAIAVSGTSIDVLDTATREVFLVEQPRASVPATPIR